MARTLPPVGALWAAFAYNPLTGQLFWLQPKQGRSLHKPAGTNDNGYRKLVMDGHPYLIHRLVWCWVNGRDPGEYDIDHIDRNRSNNCHWNLRLATPELNGVNRPGRGYYFKNDAKRAKPWCVTVYSALGTHSSCHYATEEEAQKHVEATRRQRIEVITIS